jgi:hypothetical protein
MAIGCSDRTPKGVLNSGCNCLDNLLPLRRPAVKREIDHHREDKPLELGLHDMKCASASTQSHDGLPEREDITDETSENDRDFIRCLLGDFDSGLGRRPNRDIWRMISCAESESTNSKP